jgi:hypothetical protein
MFRRQRDILTPAAITASGAAHPPTACVVRVSVVESPGANANTRRRNAVGSDLVFLYIASREFLRAAYKCRCVSPGNFYNSLFRLASLLSSFVGTSSALTGRIGGQDVHEVVMAFNPFSNFWKYKRAWMAGILLLTMATFVLCTGQAGDLSDIIQKWVMRSGTKVFSIAGKRYTDSDISDLVNQRKMANDYMKQTYLMSAEMIRREIEQPTKSADKDKEQEELKNMRVTYSRLLMQSKKPFFGNTNSLENVVEHLLWLAEADRLRIDFEDRQIDELWMLFTLQVNEQSQLVQRIPKINVLYAVQSNVGRGIATEKSVYKALRDEFRVWAAKRALLREYMQDRPTMDLMVRYEQGMDQVYDFFQKKRSSVRISLIPIYLQDLAKDMPTPSKEAIEKTFAELHKNPFQPDSDRWSLATPQQAKFAVLTADPESDRFRTAAQITTALGAYPVTALSPSAPLTSVLRFAVGTASLDKLGADRISVEPDAFMTVGLGTFKYGWPILNYYASRSEPAIASRVAASATDPIGAVAGFWAHANKDVLTKRDRKPQIDEALEYEARRRVPVIAGLWGWSASTRDTVTMPLVFDGLNMRALNSDNSEFSPMLPMNVVRTELHNRLLKDESKRLAQKMMVTLRNQLQAKYLKAGQFNADKLQDALDAFYMQYGRDGFKIEETGKFYSKLDIKDAPELKPLYSQFERTRGEFNLFAEQVYGMKKLEDDQFYMLFFENNEFYAATTDYRTCFWPTRLTRDRASEAHRVFLQDTPEHDLFAAAADPVIYWRTETEKHTGRPLALDFNAMDDVYKRTVLATNMLKARDDEGIKLAKAVAEQIILSPLDYTNSVMKLPEGKRGTRETILLPNVAPWEKVRKQSFQGGLVFDYVNFSVPYKKVPYARADMASQLLSLYEADKAFTVDIEALDSLNKSLFDLAEKTHGGRSGKVIQVLTNKPRDVYYVAVVEGYMPAFREEFEEALASGGERAIRNNFMFRYRVDFAKDMSARFVEQLKRNHDYKELDKERGLDMFKNETVESDIEDF